MDAAPIHHHKLINTAQSGLILAGMGAILAALGWIVGGDAGVVLAVAAGALLVVLNPGVSPRLVLRMYKARPIAEWEAPVLHRLTRELAQRAKLPRVPQLVYIPSAMINAFAVGSRSAATIALTDGLLRALDTREVAAVLAHELSHVRHNDMWIMGLADLFSRLTGAFAWLGQLLLLINLPLLMLSEMRISWAAILILIFAPTLSALLQLALSRTREYDADLGAAELSGDPEGLARALGKMERFQGRLFEQIFLPGRRVPDPSLLRTHPPTDERIRRLLALRGTRRRPAHLFANGAVAPPRREVSTRPPRWHAHGIWY